MMTGLVQERCVACRADAPRVTDEEIAQLHPQVPDWKLIREDGIRKLEREFRFQGFVQALAFTSGVGGLAEAEGHHPRIITEWGRVKVTWWTHKIRDLHRNDFIMAAKTDELYRGYTEAAELKVVRRAQCSKETTQTPGMERLAGVAGSTVGAKHLWMGFVTMAPGAKSGAHHHGRSESAIFILRGSARFLWGDRLEHASEAGPGDFVYVPPNLVHQEINPSGSDPIEMIVARDSAEGIVVNVDAPG